MSDKTNQATPKHTPGPWKACHDGDCPCGQVWSIPADFNVAEVLIENEENGIRIAPDQHKANILLIARAPSLLAENEKLRGLVERTKIHLEYVSKYYENPVNKQKAIDLLDEIAAALSGEQEGTPLK